MKYLLGVAAVLACTIGSSWADDEEQSRNRGYSGMVRISDTPEGAAYFVVSDNTHGIFDLVAARQELGYHPIHNAEDFL